MQAFVVFLELFVDPAQVAEMESMYDPANRSLGRERQSDTDLAMFGYYIANNIGIGFRTFAGGLLFGLGSMFFLGFNAMAVAGALVLGPSPELARVTVSGGGGAVVEHGDGHELGIGQGFSR